MRKTHTKLVVVRRSARVFLLELSVRTSYPNMPSGVHAHNFTCLAKISAKTYRLFTYIHTFSHTYTPPRSAHHLLNYSTGCVFFFSFPLKGIFTYNVLIWWNLGEVFRCFSWRLGEEFRFVIAGVMGCEVIFNLNDIKNWLNVYWLSILNGLTDKQNKYSFKRTCLSFFPSQGCRLRKKLVLM